MKKQLLIFDLDGTLADTRADLTTGINLMRAHYGLPLLDLNTVSGYIGSGIRRLVERSLQGAKVDLNEALELDRVFYNAHVVDETVLYPGVQEGLQKLVDAGHLLAVLTNKPCDSSQIIFKYFRLDRFFFRVIGGDDMSTLKPVPDGIISLMNYTGIPANDVWMIGDHHTDLEAAYNAGVKSGFVTYGIGNPGEFSATQTWNGFDDLTDFFTTGQGAS